MDAWSSGYYEVAESGDVLVRPLRGERAFRGHRRIDESTEPRLASLALPLRPHSALADLGPSHRLVDLVDACLDSGATLPLLLSFPDIVRDRIRAQHACFRESIAKYEYAGSYACAFPLKANHSADLVETLLSINDEGEVKCSLEVGSKPELLIAVAQACAAKRPRSVQIICNGFKDRDFIELALATQRALGLDIILCIDRYEEIDLVLDRSEALGARPNLGVRAKLSTRHEGHWGGSSGHASKFGLTAVELLSLVSRLEESGMLTCLTMLHFHLGSQIDEIAIIKSAMREACALYGELCALGAPLTILDVGGGLAVTYDGPQGAWHPQYTLQNYANDIVAAVNDMCVQRGVSAPLIVTESGRALASHHSLLVFSAEYKSHSAEGRGPGARGVAEDSKMAYFFKTFEEVFHDLVEKSGNPEEADNDALQFRKEAESAFALGIMTLEEVAYAETLFGKIMAAVASSLGDREESGRAALEAARSSSATPCVANLSIFRSAIDSWAIDQSFPLVPVTDLDKKPNTFARVYDLTCDSDGEIKAFVTKGGTLSPVLPIYCEDSEESAKGSLLLALFLLGAYQESMGNYHNLLGQTCAATITFPEEEGNGACGKGTMQISRLRPAETAREILAKANYSPEDLAGQVEIAARGNGEEGGEHLLSVFETLLSRSGYLAHDSPM